MEMSRESALLLILNAAPLLALGDSVVFDLECHVNQYWIHKNNIWVFSTILILDLI